MFSLHQWLFLASLFLQIQEKNFHLVSYIFFNNHMYKKPFKIFRYINHKVLLSIYIYEKFCIHEIDLGSKFWNSRKRLCSFLLTPSIVIKGWFWTLPSFISCNMGLTIFSYYYMLLYIYTMSIYHISHEKHHTKISLCCYEGEV